MIDGIDNRQDASLGNADQEKYIVHWRAEIVSILSDLCRTGNLVTAYVDGNDEDFILTSIVAVMIEQNTVLLDYGANAVANMRAMAASRIVCVTSLDGIRIQMSVESFHPDRFAGRRVFAMTMPDTLLRLQRREYYRIATPRGNPLVCIVEPSEVQRGVPREMMIDDISCGGIAIVLPDSSVGIETGKRFNNCRIPLPDMAEVTGFGNLYSTGGGSSGRVPLPTSAEVTADIVVKGIVEIKFPNGVTHRHAGCEFIDIRERDRALIQRYVSRLEHDRRYRVRTR